MLPSSCRVSGLFERRVLSNVQLGKRKERLLRGLAFDSVDSVW